MNMSEAMVALFNRQISHECHNHQVYRFFANRLNNIGLTKIGGWMKSQADGEIGHQDLLVSYCEDRNIDVEMLAVESVDLSYSSILDVAKLVLSLEEKTTAMLKEMTALALSEGDLLTFQWLMENMLREQIEEESKAQTLIDQLTNIGSEMCMIQLFDNGFSL